MHITSCLVVCLAAPLLTAVPEDRKPIPDVEGTWERFVENDGERHRIVKQHKQGKTTLTLYDSNKKIVYQHQSKYVLEDNEQVKIFTYFATEATAGPDKGKRREEKRAYAYRIHDNLFFEFRGVLKIDAVRPEIIVWRKIADKDQPR